MFMLSLLWILIGLVIGVLANAVRRHPASWGRQGWLYLPAVGALLSLLGGWLGALLLGALFATATAILAAVAGVMVYAVFREHVI
jgi:uncharacterized membrane protein YeaQ/YmgE (transglycosylase-associated protein family)